MYRASAVLIVIVELFISAHDTVDVAMQTLALTTHRNEVIQFTAIAVELASS